MAKTSHLLYIENHLFTLLDNNAAVIEGYLYVLYKKKITLHTKPLLMDFKCHGKVMGKAINDLHGRIKHPHLDTRTSLADNVPQCLLDMKRFYILLHCQLQEESLHGGNA